MTEAIISIRPLTDDEALAWLRARPDDQMSASELSRRWSWPRTKVRRRLEAWRSAGLIGRAGQEVATLPGQPGHLPASLATSNAGGQLPVAAPQHTGRLMTGAAYLSAVTLAGAAAYFSVRGMVVLFPGAPAAVVVMATAMEASKLVTVGWLARHWRRTIRPFRSVLVVLVTGLAAINATGVYSQLVAAHLGDRATVTSSVESESATLAARIEVQSHAVADLDNRLGQIDAAIAEMTRRGRTAGALEAIGAQHKARDALVGERRREADALAGLKADQAATAAKARAVAVEAAPIMYVAALFGGTTGQAIRLLILLMVLCCDPLAIALTAAAAAAR
jgi:hypothetical protein